MWTASDLHSALRTCAPHCNCFRVLAALGLSQDAAGSAPPLSLSACTVRAFYLAPICIGSGAPVALHTGLCACVCAPGAYHRPSSAIAAGLWAGQKRSSISAWPRPVLTLSLNLLRRRGSWRLSRWAPVREYDFSLTLMHLTCKP